MNENQKIKTVAFIIIICAMFTGYALGYINGYNSGTATITNVTYSQATRPIQVIINKTDNLIDVYGVTFIDDNDLTLGSKLDYISTDNRILYTVYIPKNWTGTTIYAYYGTEHINNWWNTSWKFYQPAEECD